jgi:hypothetical protein
MILSMTLTVQSHFEDIVQPKKRVVERGTIRTVVLVLLKGYSRVLNHKKLISAFSAKKNMETFFAWRALPKTLKRVVTLHYFYWWWCEEWDNLERLTSIMSTAVHRIPNIVNWRSNSIWYLKILSSQKRGGYRGYQSICFDFLHHCWCFFLTLKGLIFWFKFQKTVFSV